MSTLSSKCTKNTKSLIHEIFKNDSLFNELHVNCDVMINISWLCKFSIKCLLDNTEMMKPKNVSSFVYDCHYVDKFDEMLLNHLKNIQTY